MPSDDKKDEFDLLGEEVECYPIGGHGGRAWKLCESCGSPITPDGCSCIQYPTEAQILRRENDQLRQHIKDLGKAAVPANQLMYEQEVAAKLSSWKYVTQLQEEIRKLKNDKT